MEDGCLVRTDMEGTEEFPVLCVTKEGKRGIAAILARESSLSVTLNEPELAGLLCTATNLDYLAVGFIASEGLLGSNHEIKMIAVDGKNGMVRVETIDDKRQPQDTLPKQVIACSGGRGLASATLEEGRVANEYLDRWSFGPRGEIPVSLSHLQSNGWHPFSCIVRHKRYPNLG